MSPKSAPASVVEISSDDDVSELEDGPPAPPAPPQVFGPPTASGEQALICEVPLVYGPADQCGARPQVLTVTSCSGSKEEIQET